MRMKLKRMLSLFLAVVMLLTSIGIQSIDVKAAEENTNLLQGKTVTASSVEAAMPGNTPDQIADNNTSTRWSSEKMKETGATDASTQIAQWLVVDLGEGEYDVSEIKVSFFFSYYFFPVPLVNIDRMNVVSFFIATDGTHICVKSFAVGKSVFF